MLLSGYRKLKEIREYQKQEKKLIKELDTKDLIRYGKLQINKTDCDLINSMHEYAVAIMRFDDLQYKKNNLHRYRDVGKEAMRLKKKLGLERKSLFMTWKSEAAKHKGEGVSVAAVYYKTVGLYLHFVKNRG